MSFPVCLFGSRACLQVLRGEGAGGEGVQEREGAIGVHDPLVRPLVRHHGRHACRVSGRREERRFALDLSFIVGSASALCCFLALEWFCRSGGSLAAIDHRAERQLALVLIHCWLLLGR